MRNVLAGFVVIAFVTWGWALIFLAAAVLPATPVEERLFKVSGVEDCTRKCIGCFTRVEFSNWVGAAGSRFCVDALESRPKVGQLLSVRGRFHVLVQQVRAIERPEG
jgi:hypothetical protein